MVKYFFKEASVRSSDEFKLLFGRILAGEIRNPGEFSSSTIQAISKLDKNTAEVFQRACNISTSGMISPRIIDNPFGSAGENGLTEFGLSYNALTMLVEIGLLRPTINEWQEIHFHKNWKNDVYLTIGNNSRILHFEHKEELYRFRLTGPAFTTAGQELRKIIAMKTPENYLSKLISWLNENRISVRLNEAKY